ncbi:MAG: rhomboid family intramembrane serine protease [Chthoniobacterales bacterium]
MKFLDRMEQRFGRFAIPDLIRYVVILNALVYVIQFTSPGYSSFLQLYRPLVLQGEVWRLITWVFIPGGGSNTFFVLIALLFLWFLGEGLESMMGSFRVNLFYFTGIIACTASAMIFGNDSGVGSGLGAGMFLNLSVLFAFATLQPNMSVMLFFIIPVKIKWIAFFSLALLILSFVGFSLIDKAITIASLANYLLFFGPAFIRSRADMAKTAARRADFESKLRSEDEALYTCKTCGRSDISHPDLEFRVAADGEEYCTEHLPGRQS